MFTLFGSRNKIVPTAGITPSPRAPLSPTALSISAPPAPPPPTFLRHTASEDLPDDDVTGDGKHAFDGVDEADMTPYHDQPTPVDASAPSVEEKKPPASSYESEFSEDLGSSVDDGEGGHIDDVEDDDGVVDYEESVPGAEEPAWAVMGKHDPPPAPHESVRRGQARVPIERDGRALDDGASAPWGKKRGVAAAKAAAGQKKPGKASRGSRLRSGLASDGDAPSRVASTEVRVRDSRPRPTIIEVKERGASRKRKQAGQGSSPEESHGAGSSDDEGGGGRRPDASMPAERRRGEAPPAPPAAHTPPGRVRSHSPASRSRSPLGAAWRPAGSPAANTAAFPGRDLRPGRMGLHWVSAILPPVAAVAPGVAGAAPPPLPTVEGTGLLVHPEQQQQQQQQEADGPRPPSVGSVARRQAERDRAVGAKRRAYSQLKPVVSPAMKALPASLLTSYGYAPPALPPPAQRAKAEPPLVAPPASPPLPPSTATLEDPSGSSPYRHRHPTQAPQPAEAAAAAGLQVSGMGVSAGGPRSSVGQRQRQHEALPPPPLPDPHQRRSSIGGRSTAEYADDDYLPEDEQQQQQQQQHEPQTHSVAAGSQRPSSTHAPALAPAREPPGSAGAPASPSTAAPELPEWFFSVMQETSARVQRHSLPPSPEQAVSPASRASSLGGMATLAQGHRRSASGPPGSRGRTESAGDAHFAPGPIAIPLSPKTPSSFLPPIVKPGSVPDALDTRTARTPSARGFPVAPPSPTRSAALPAAAAATVAAAGSGGPIGHWQPPVYTAAVSLARSASKGLISAAAVPPPDPLPVHTAAVSLPLPPAPVSVALGVASPVSSSDSAVSAVFAPPVGMSSAGDGGSGPARFIATPTGPPAASSVSRMSAPASPRQQQLQPIAEEEVVWAHGAGDDGPPRPSSEAAAGDAAAVGAAEQVTPPPAPLAVSRRQPIARSPRPAARVAAASPSPTAAQAPTPAPTRRGRSGSPRFTPPASSPTVVDRLAASVAAAEKRAAAQEAAAARRRAAVSPQSATRTAASSTPSHVRGAGASPQVYRPAVVMLPSRGSITMLDSGVVDAAESPHAHGSRRGGRLAPGPGSVASHRSRSSRSPHSSGRNGHSPSSAGAGSISPGSITGVTMSPMRPPPPLTRTVLVPATGEAIAPTYKSRHAAAAAAAAEARKGEWTASPPRDRALRRDEPAFPAPPPVAKAKSLAAYAASVRPSRRQPAPRPAPTAPAGVAAVAAPPPPQSAGVASASAAASATGPSASASAAGRRARSLPPQGTRGIAAAASRRDPPVAAGAASRSALVQQKQPQPQSQRKGRAAALASPNARPLPLARKDRSPANSSRRRSPPPPPKQQQPSKRRGGGGARSSSPRGRGGGHTARSSSPRGRGGGYASRGGSPKKTAWGGGGGGGAKPAAVAAAATLQPAPVKTQPSFPRQLLRIRLAGAPARTASSLPVGALQAQQQAAAAAAAASPTRSPMSASPRGAPQLASPRGAPQPASTRRSGQAAAPSPRNGRGGYAGQQQQQPRGQAAAAAGGARPLPPPAAGPHPGTPTGWRDGADSAARGASRGHLELAAAESVADAAAAAAAVYAAEFEDDEVDDADEELEVPLDSGELRRQLQATLAQHQQLQATLAQQRTQRRPIQNAVGGVFASAGR